MTTVAPPPPQPHAPHALEPRDARRRARLFRPVRALACCTLGLIATAAISAASAMWLPFTRPLPLESQVLIRGSTAYPMVSRPATLAQRLELWTAAHEKVEVAVWGDHLQPWHLRITTPFASRLTWFEKGRVYSRPDVAAPPAASGAAVSCWSFSTACWSFVGSKLTGPLPAPSELTQSNQARTTWATAIEERGWPFRAFTCRIAAPMGNRTDDVYTVSGGVFATGDGPPPGGEIQTVKVVPTTPMWPGLIADSLLIGAALYTLSFVPGVARRALRTRRGRCPVCAYDLHGQPAPGCPECGWNRQTPDPVTTP